MPLKWETHATAQYGRPAQEDINEHLTDLADMVIGIFWSRLGTPTTEHKSGSVEEITRHSAAGKPVMMYFTEAPIPNSADLDQVKAVRDFRKSAQEKGTLWSFQSREEFRVHFSRHLAIEMERSHFSIEAQARSIQDQNAIPLSRDADSLLRTAAGSKDGLILRVRAQYLQSIHASGKNYTSENTARDSARWIAVLEELLHRGFIVSLNDKGTTYQVTQAGYKFLETHFSSDSAGSELTGARRSLSTDALKLLTAASKGPGCVMELHSFDGWSLQAQEESFPDLSTGGAKQEARWRAALRELLEDELLDPKTGDVYRVSHTGFAVVEELASGETN